MPPLIEQNKFAQACPSYAVAVKADRVNQLSSQKTPTVTKVSLFVLGSLGFLAIAGGAAVFYFTGFNSILFMGISGGLFLTGLAFEIWTLVLIASISKRKKAALKQAGNIPSETITKKDPHLLDALKTLEKADMPKCLSLLPSTSESSYSLEDVLNSLVPTLNDRSTENNAQWEKARDILSATVNSCGAAFKTIPLERLNPVIIDLARQLVKPESDIEKVEAHLVTYCLSLQPLNENLHTHSKVIAQLTVIDQLRDKIFFLYTQMGVDTGHKTNFFSHCPNEILLLFSESLMVQDNLSESNLVAIFSKIENGHYVVAEHLIQKGYFNKFTSKDLEVLAKVLKPEMIKAILVAHGDKPDMLVSWMYGAIVDDKGLRGPLLGELKIYPQLLAHFPLLMYADQLTFDHVESSQQAAYLQALSPTNLPAFIAIYIDKVHSYNRSWEDPVLHYKNEIITKLSEYNEFRIERLLEVTDKLDCYKELNTKLALQLYKHAVSIFESEPDKSKALFAKLMERKDISTLIGSYPECKPVFLAYIFNEALKNDTNNTQITWLESFSPAMQLTVLKAIHVYTPKDEADQRIRNILCYLGSREKIRSLLSTLEINTAFRNIIQNWLNYEHYEFEQAFLKQDNNSIQSFLKKNSKGLDNYLTSLNQNITLVQQTIITFVFADTNSYKIDINKLPATSLIEILNVINPDIKESLLKELGNMNATSLLTSFDKGKGPFALFATYINDQLKSVNSKVDVEKLKLSKVVLALVVQQKYLDKITDYPHISRAHNLIKGNT